VNAALLGRSRAEALARFPAIIRFAELERFIDLKLKNYSSGMQVRLGFAAAIQADADIYLVDEVLAVGDARFQEKCFDVFRRMKRDGRTVIFVTHDMGSVERFCDRVALLEGGEVAAIGDARTVILTYRQRDLEIEQQQPQRTTGNDARRWGDGAAEILETWLEDARGRRESILIQGSTAAIRTRIRFERPMSNPVLGVVVKAENGVAVFAKNTAVNAMKIGEFEARDEVIFSLRFDVWLADGHYTVSPAIAYEDAERIADWREDFIDLAVRGKSSSGGLVDLPSETSIERVVRTDSD
jgi:ABC-type glutathione transport system ATPase component